MHDTLPLHDGGAFYHPREPLGFHPSLRAAGQLLVAGERCRAGLRQHLYETFVAGPPVRLSLLSAPTVWFDPEHGFRVMRGYHSRGARRRLLARLEPANRIVRWSQERHLASPWVLELLLLTVSSWQDLEARSRRLDHRLTELEAAGGSAHPALRRRLREQKHRLARCSAGWGPWVEALDRPPEEADVTLLVELSRVHHLPYLRRPRRRAPGSQLRVDVTGWHIELETWKEARERIRRELESELDRLAATARKAAHHAGYRPTPTKTASHHFEWLALRQLQGLGPSRLARRFGAGVSTVRRALRELSELLELPLRLVSPGPSGL